MTGGLCIWGSPLEAVRMAAEYRMAFGPEWTIWIQ